MLYIALLGDPLYQSLELRWGNAGMHAAEGYRVDRAWSWEPDRPGKIIERVGRGVQAPIIIPHWIAVHSRRIILGTIGALAVVVDPVRKDWRCPSLIFTDRNIKKFAMILRDRTRDDYLDVSCINN